MSAKVYNYVGPPEIAAAVGGGTDRRRITCAEGIRLWLSPNSRDAETVTFVIDAEGELWVADRRSEHVACARGGPVLSAGEMTFDVGTKVVEVVYVTNQSTGYCPEPASWNAVAAALDRAAISHPDRFDVECEFRKCDCGQINIVKNDIYLCAVCGAELSATWNLLGGAT